MSVAAWLSNKAFIISGTTTRPGVLSSFSCISFKAGIWRKMDGVKADIRLLSRTLKVLKFGKADTADTEFRPRRIKESPLQGPAVRGDCKGNRGSRQAPE